MNVEYKNDKWIFEKEGVYFACTLEQVYDLNDALNYVFDKMLEAAEDSNFIVTTHMQKHKKNWQIKQTLHENSTWCGLCMKAVKKEGLKQHMKDAHKRKSPNKSG